MTTMNAAPRPRRRWTEDEDRVLRREANYQLSMGCLKDWNRIAAKVPGRTNKDCRKRWSKVCDNVKKGAWDGAEDERLQNAVRMYGYRWTQVAQMVGTRHADQCAKRWHHSLDPNVDHSEWKQEEDDRLLAAVQVYGRNWKIIGEKEFPGRSTTDIKNRYAIVSRKRIQSTASERASSISHATMFAPQSREIHHMEPTAHSPTPSATSDGRYESPLPQLTHSASASPYTPPGQASFQVSPRSEHKPSIASSVGASSQIHHEMAAAAAAAVSGASGDPTLSMESPSPSQQHHSYGTVTTASSGFVAQTASSNPFIWDHQQVLSTPSWSTEPVQMGQNEQRMDSVNPVNVEDWGMVDAAEAANVADPAELGEMGDMNGMKLPSQTTLIIENVEPTTLNNILNILFKTKTKVKLETLH